MINNQYIVYYVFILLAAIFAYLAQVFSTRKNGEYKLNKFLYFISFSILLILVGFRVCGVGVDDYEYKRIFNAVSVDGPIEYFLKTTLEPGYILANWLIGFFTNDFQIVLVITTIIPLIFFYKAFELWQEKINFFLAFCLFGALMIVYFIGINRLFIAVGIFAYSLKYFLKNDRKRFNYLILFILF